MPHEPKRQTPREGNVPHFVMFFLFFFLTLPCFSFFSPNFFVFTFSFHVFHFLFFLVLFLFSGAQNLIFFALNCCKISFTIS